MQQFKFDISIQFPRVFAETRRIVTIVSWQAAIKPGRGRALSGERAQPSRAALTEPGAVGTGAAALGLNTALLALQLDFAGL
jgi:hypothetical protein